MPRISPTTLIDFAIPKWQAYPGLQIVDAYKWLFQAVLGGEHMVSDRNKAVTAIETEWLSVGPAFENEAVWEVLRPDEAIGRLNIRPFKEAGGDPADLADAFIKSSSSHSSELKDLLSVWNGLGERLTSMPGGQLTFSEWSELDNELRPLGYTAVHHSDAYRAKYMPAYRDLTAQAFATLASNLKAS